MMRATWVVLALLGCAVVETTVAPQARADEPPAQPQPQPQPQQAPAPTAAPSAQQADEARKYYEAGRQAFAAGQFVVAISAFEEAYKIAPRTSVKFSLAMAYRAQYFIDRDAQKVRRANELFLAVVNETPQGELREKAAGFLAELSPVVMRLDDEEARRREAEKARAAAAEHETSTAAGAAEAAARGEKPAAPPPEPTPPPPAPAKTQLMISSRTPGAKAAIDNEALAEAPVIKETTPGKHKVRVELDGYFPQTVEGTAVEGRFIVVEVNLEPMPAALSINAPAGAEVSVDGKPVGEAPLRRAVDLPAGNHQVLVLARGHRAWSQEVTLARGEKKSVDAKLNRTAQRKASYMVLGLAGATALAGGVTTALAFSAQSDAQDIESKLEHGMNITPEEVDEHRRLSERRDSLQTASYFLYGSAFVVATTGVFLYFVDQPRAEASAATTPMITPSIQKDQFTVSLVTRF
jgi:tetratricopeptide (TPR) repeat protein